MNMSKIGRCEGAARERKAAATAEESRNTRRRGEKPPLGGGEAVEEALLGAAPLTGNLGQLCHCLRPPPDT